MDLKKLSSDQFPHSLSPRRKVVSGFRLGVVVFLTVLIVVLFNVSLKTPFLTPVFQGFNGFRVNNWPFSFSSTSASSFSSSSDSTRSRDSLTVPSEELKNTEDFKQRAGDGKVADKTHEANLSVISENSNVLEDAHLGNFTFEEGRVREKAQYVNSKGEGAVLEGIHLGNSSQEVKNGGDVVVGNVAETLANEKTFHKSVGFVDNSKNGKNKITENDSGGSVGCSKKNNISVSCNGSQPTERNNGFNGKCDLFDGRWVRDDTKPYYPAGSCPYIDRDFDCHLNGRPDGGFLKWKWKPYGCDMPSLNATDFLERLRGKKLVFVGDSLNRNMWESLVCILRHSIRNKKRVYEITGRREFKKNGFYAFRFEDYDCSVDFVGTPFLVKESSFNGRNGSFETLRLDLMDQTTSMYHDADVVIFNTGHWWTHEKTSKGEDYYQEGNHVYPRLKVLEAYKRALTTWARWVDKNIDGSRTQVIFRGYSVNHFKGGQWNSGGQCHKETEPIFNETYLTKYPSKMRVLQHVLHEMKTPVIYLNVSRLTDYRKDGHPSIYRKEYKTVEEQAAAEQSQDCSHWCLPGIPDAWNELLYASLLQAGKGSWGKLNGNL